MVAKLGSLQDTPKVWDLGCILGFKENGEVSQSTLEVLSLSSCRVRGSGGSLLDVSALQASYMSLLKTLFTLKS